MKIYLMISLFLLSLGANAGNIRSIYVNHKKMQTIWLQMGKSTVIRLMNKPRKVVVGNSNYFSVEFIDNDVTIQPQGLVTTNLFIYGKHHTYGFILKVNQTGYYDDRVDIKWKAHQLLEAKKINTKISVKKFKEDIVFNGVVALRILKITNHGPLEAYLIDGEVENLSQKKIVLKELDLFATRKDLKINPQRLVFLDEELLKGKKTKFRVFITSKERKGFSLNLSFKGEEKKIIIQRKFL